MALTLWEEVKDHWQFEKVMLLSRWIMQHKPVIES